MLLFYGILDLSISCQSNHRCPPERNENGDFVRSMHSYPCNNDRRGRSGGNICDGSEITLIRDGIEKR